MSILRTALFGLGKIGSTHYKNLKTFNDKFKIANLFEIKSNITIDYPETIIDPRDAEEELSKGTIDAAIICSPTEFHFDQIHACLNNGIPVFVEKPIS